MINAARNGAGWLLLSLPFTMALVFSGAFWEPFAAPKNAILVFTSFALAALALTFSSQWRLDGEALYFTFAAATYVALTVISAIHSQYGSVCLQSVVLVVCGLLLFIATLACLSGDSRVLNMRNLQIAISAAAVLVSLLTIVQFFSIDLQGAFGLYSNFSGRMRMYATVGNPDFVAAFLAVAIPAAISLSITSRRLRVLWVSGAALIGVAIVLTGSRAGVIALAAGVTVLAFTVIRKRGLVMLAVVLACALAAGTKLNLRTPGESLRGRIFIWQVSMGNGAARSAVGSGSGTFSSVYPSQMGQFFSKPGRQSLLHFAGHERHAQNDFVEVWHDTGWLGLGSLLAVLGYWFEVAIRRLRQSDQQARPAVAAAIASVSALAVASLFDFPMHRAETWAMLWLSMSVPFLSPALPPAPRRRPGWLRYTVAALLLVAGMYSAFAPLAASYETAKGQSEENQGRLKSSAIAYRAALQWEPSSPEANFDLARVTAKAGDYSGALAQSSLAVRYVNEPELYILRSRILHQAGRDSEAQRDVEAAMRVFPYSMELRDEVASFPPPDTKLKSR